MKEKEPAQRIFHTRAMVTILLAALFAIIINTITGDSSVWSWAIPLGVVIGVAPHVGKELKS